MCANFALTGAAGFVAPRHLQAIHDTGNRLVAAVDRSDSVGVMDRFFPDTHFFTEFERFDRHVEMLRRTDPANRVEYVSICSPNYLHDAHVRFALRVDADAICEKPLVLNPWNLDALAQMEAETGKRVFTVLQLRMHPSIIALKERIEAQGGATRHSVKLTYMTSRGRWYFSSWKGDPAKSGGLSSNIGVHFFDMLAWVFGPPRESTVHFKDPQREAGVLELESADVSWFLSVNQEDLPPDCKESGQTMFRSIEVDGQELEFTGGFEGLHTAVYEGVLAGSGYGIEDTRPSIELVHSIRNSPNSSSRLDLAHPSIRALLPGQAP